MPKVAVMLRAPGPGGDELAHMIELVQGPAALGFEAQMLEHGLRSNSVFSGTDEAGRYFVLVVEADDPEAAFARLESADNPIARWVRENVTRITGFSTATMQPLQVLMDWQAPRTP